MLYGVYKIFIFQKITIYMWGRILTINGGLSRLCFALSTFDCVFHWG